MCFGEASFGGSAFYLKKRLLPLKAASVDGDYI